ncbi:MAG: gamma carbonic anhydrase family protein [Deltaproteobacteria bacterium]|nr:gamma carbonic anhydrase family protein [Deltaproteobacteria bacterium]MBW2413947.1 gamma carbonic anhydrase family protein [Deltaproteobacteria bacterium]
MRPILLPYRGRLPEIAPDVWIAPGASVIGDVGIGAGSSVWFGCVIRGDVERIRIGARTNVQDRTVIHVTRDRFATRIGDAVTIGHAAVVHGCTLGDRAFIGMGAIVMDGATVESDAMLAAGALLPPGRTVPAGELWAGTPARCVRELRPDEHEAHAEQNRLYFDLGREYREA